MVYSDYLTVYSIFALVSGLFCFFPDFRVFAFSVIFQVSTSRIIEFEIVYRDCYQEYISRLSRLSGIRCDRGRLTTVVRAYRHGYVYRVMLHLQATYHVYVHMWCARARTERGRDGDGTGHLRPGGSSIPVTERVVGRRAVDNRKSIT